MNKLIAFPVAFILLGSSVAFAQGYSFGSCVSISSNLSVGSRGSDVRSLQSFLVAQNYPGGGSWMITGYFGQATAAAVRNFQQSTGQPVTGWVDAQTRATIQSRSCGNVVNSYPPVTPVYSYPTPSYPTYPTYTTPTYTVPTYTPTYTTPINYSYPNISGNVTLTSISSNNVMPGTSVTVYGIGFDLSNNTVYVGSNAAANVASQNGTSLTFTVPPFVSYGTTDVHIANPRGVSNSLALNVVSTQNPCGIYGTSCGGCQYTQNIYGTNCGDGHVGAPTIISISPVAGGVNSVVTIYGSGFTASGNTVHFGNGIIANVSSQDGRGLTFTVSTVLTGFGAQQLALASYPVSVTNARGETSNSIGFNVTSLAGTNNTPTFGTVSGPTALTLGTSGTWTVQVNNPSNAITSVAVSWGDANNGYVNTAAPQVVTLQGLQTLTFSHAYFTAGTFTVTFSVSNSNGTNVSTATVVVTGSSNNGTLSLISLSPSSGRVGTPIVILGSGFTGTNDVHFGVGGIRNAAATGNGTISFTIPSVISPCDLLAISYGACSSPATAVVPGTYPMYVTNSAGATNILYFTVTP